MTFRPQLAYETIRGALEKDQRILVVVVESLGRPLNDKVGAVVFAPLRSMAGYEASEGVESFNGATIQGELRVLCGLAPIGKPHIADILESDLMQHCLPNVFSEKPSEAYHGNASAFYGRRVVYPRMGFKKTGFREQFAQLRRGCTSSYDAICDREMLRIIDEGRESRFSYLLTIDTHHPYSKRQYNMPGHCKDQALSKYWADICVAINEIASDVEKSGSYDRVVIVGDHAPPLINEADRSQVPVFMLERRGLEINEPAA